jgi:methylenetetrahydrofolate dehydrogenase (NADP+)/methenyltetrahydrofolate cyclohydrolase
MGARIIDGKMISADLRGKVTDAVHRLRRDRGIVSGLAVVMVGKNPASEVYVRNKSKAVTEAGMHPFDRVLPESTSEAEVLGLIAELNADKQVNGILVQLPLPQQIDPQKIIEAIDPAKDVDGFHPLNVGKLARGLPGLVPCTPLGCIMLAKTVLASLEGIEAVIVGRSNIVGKPVMQMLLAENATVTICHSKTRDLPAVCQRADLLIAAIGRPEFVRGHWLKPGATVIDVGINRVAGADGKHKIVGDVAYAEAAQVAGAITPVPGGVGPMTIACLLFNTLRATCMQNDLPAPSV